MYEDLKKLEASEAKGENHLPSHKLTVGERLRKIE